MRYRFPRRIPIPRTRGWLRDRICICYGGFVAETIVYGETTTGTKQDLQQATDIARKMVCEFGMADAVGPVTYGQEDEPIFIGKEIARHKDYSEESARIIDQTIRSILEEMRTHATAIITEHRDELDKLTEELLLKETLDDAEIRVLLGMPAKITDLPASATATISSIATEPSATPSPEKPEESGV